MITNPATVVANPARDLSIRVWVWFSMHRRVSYVLAFLACCAVSNFILIGQAHAADGPSVPIVGFPASEITDTHGVPISRYLELPFDTGNVTHPVRSARYVIASLLWTIYAAPQVAMLAMLDWMLTFEWLEWITAPFELVANSIQGLMDGIGIIGVAVAVTGLAIAVALLRGRKSSGWVELAMVVLMFGVIASPIANPIQWITGNDGWVQTSRDIGMEAGELTTPGGGNTSEDSSIVSGVIVDMTLRDPMLTMSWGSTFAGNQECTDHWNHNALDGASSPEDIRTEVNNCDSAAKTANETDSFVFLAPFGLALLTALGVMFMVGVFLVFLVLAVGKVLLGAVNTVIKGYFALFPGNGRYAFFNALAQTFIAAVSVGIYIWLLIVYLWGIDYVGTMMPNNGAHIGLLMGLLILGLAITFITLKMKGKKAGEAIARMLGRNGLSNPSQGQQSPSAFKQGIAQSIPSTSARAMRQLQRGRKLRRVAKLAAAAGTGGAAAAATAATATVAQAGTAKAARAAAVTGGQLTSARTRNPAALELNAAKTASEPRTGNTADNARGENPVATSALAPRSRGMEDTPREHGAIPLGPRREDEQANTTARAVEASAAHRAALSAPAQGDRPTNAAPAAQGPKAPGGAAVYPRTNGNTEQESSTHRPSAPNGTRKSNLPPGRYGTVWVHANGTSTTLHTGPSSPVPSRDKVNKVWDIASPDVPVSRSQRETGQPGRSRTVAAARSAANQVPTPSGGGEGQRTPRPMRKAGE